MNTSDQRHPLVALILWLSVLSAQSVIGFAVAPRLFAHLDRVVAGRIAGELLTGVEWLVIVAVAAGVLVWPQRRVVFLSVIVLLLQAVQLLWLNPLMAELKRQGVGDSSQFMLLHGVSQALFMLAAGVLALLVVMAVRALRRPPYLA